MEQIGERFILVLDDLHAIVEVIGNSLGVKYRLLKRDDRKTMLVSRSLHLGQQLKRRRPMKGHRSKLILFSLPLMLGIYLLMPTFQVLAQDTRTAQPDQKAEPRSSAEVDSYLAGMSDAKVRKA